MSLDWGRGWDYPPAGMGEVGGRLENQEGVRAAPSLERGNSQSCCGLEWGVTGLSQEITALLPALMVTSSVTLPGSSRAKRKAGIK